MKLLGIGDNVFDHYRWRKELYPGGNSVNVPVLARRYDGSETGYIGLIADDREGRHFLKALDEEGLDVSRVRMMHGVTAATTLRSTSRATDTLWATMAAKPPSISPC